MIEAEATGFASERRDVEADAELADRLMRINASDLDDEDNEMARKWVRHKHRWRHATLQSLTPSDEDLKAMTVEEEAAWAGVPPPAPPRMVYLPLLPIVRSLARVRPALRARRTRWVRTLKRARAPGRPADEPEPPLDGREVAA